MSHHIARTLASAAAVAGLVVSPLAAASPAGAAEAAEPSRAPGHGSPWVQQTTERVYGHATLSDCNMMRRVYQYEGARVSGCYWGGSYYRWCFYATWS